VAGRKSTLFLAVLRRHVKDLLAVEVLRSLLEEEVLVEIEVLVKMLHHGQTVYFQFATFVLSSETY